MSRNAASCDLPGAEGRRGACRVPDRRAAGSVILAASAAEEVLRRSNPRNVLDNRESSAFSVSLSSNSWGDRVFVSAIG